MFRNICLLLVVLVGFNTAFAQSGSRHLRISLLTCGPEDNEIWEVFGHTAVRVIDSDTHTDIVYNYGTFDFGPDFEVQFMRGKLLYCIACDQYSDFLPEYVQAHRSVQEQVLLLNWKQRELLDYFLKWNTNPENKYYKYDFFFDNCATRIRDIFTRPEIFGPKLQWGQTIPPGKRISFRNIINQYFYRDHWTRVGVNILLGSRIDRPMSTTDIMFLPDYLRDGVAGATSGGQRISTDPVLLLPGNKPQPAGLNWPFFVTSLVAALTIAGLTKKKLYRLGRIMSTLLLSITGLLGCLILVMWFGTDHQGCSDNFNLLWCLPTNIVVAFFKPRGRARYAIIALLLLLVSLILHIFKVQGLTLLELGPLFLALLFVYGTIYKNAGVTTTQ